MSGVRLRAYLNRWVIIGALLIAFLMCGCMMLLVLYPMGTTGSSISKTAVMDVIRMPTASAVHQTADATLMGLSSTPQNISTPLPGELGIGVVVQVTDTGGDGLRLRDEPGLEGQVLMLGNEAEVFKLVDGPQEFDGYTWWYLVGLYDETRQGWGVSDYLKIIEDQ